MPTLPQIDATQFLYKIVGIGIALAVFLLYSAVRYLVSGRNFLMAPQLSELGFLSKGEASIKELQSGIWRANADKTITFGSVSLSTIILAAIFVFQQHLAGYDAAMWSLILAVFATSTLAYFASLQLWFLALDAGGSIQARLSYRRTATAFQTTGWLSLELASILSVMAVNTYLGYAIAVLAIVAFVFIAEFKLKVALDDDAMHADFNDFQKSLAA